MTWRSIAENTLPTPAPGSLVAVIIGRTPSQGARSPLLWNAAFERLGIAGHMFPVDVDEDALGPLVAALRDDDAFIGGAVTMPHKAAVIPFLARTDAVASSAGAVNAILRANDGLLGSNTDGVAALRSIERVTGPLNGARVLLLGAGGAGSAVAAAVAGRLGSAGEMMVANRATDRRDALIARLADTSPARVIACPTWPVVEAGPLGTFDVIINTSSLGFALPVPADDGWVPSRFLTPLTGTLGFPVMERDAAEVATADDLAAPLAETRERALEWLGPRSEALVFDAIYQPERTLLLELAGIAGCRTMNGGWMNLEQAVIAFASAIAAATGDEPDTDEVRDAMQAAVEGTS